jgi:hypothetical protein
MAAFICSNRSAFFHFCGTRPKYTTTLVMLESVIFAAAASATGRLPVSLIHESNISRPCSRCSFCVSAFLLLLASCLAVVVSRFSCLTSAFACCFVMSAWLLQGPSNRSSLFEMRPSLHCWSVSPASGLSGSVPTQFEWISIVYNYLSG